MSPLSVLLVDDDKPMLDWLAGLPWAEHRCRVLGACLNGEQALRLAREELPDLVLTDIVMPLMDGLELTRALKALKPGVQVILLSSYREFDYARTALQLDVRDYLLKGVFTPDQLFAAVDRCRQALSDRPDAPPHPSEPRYPAEVYWLRPRAASELPRLRALLERAALEDLCLQEAPETRGLLALCAPKPRRRERDGLLAALRPFPRSELILAYGGRVHCPAELEGALRLALRRADQAFYDSQARLLDRDQAFEAFTLAQCDQIRQRLSTLRGAAWRDYVWGDLLSELRARRIAPASVRALVAGWVASACLSFGLSDAQEHTEAILLSQHVDALLSAMEGFEQALRERQLPSVQRDIALAVTMMRERFAEDLSLEQVAESLGYSPNYLGARFSKEMGTSFREYLTQLRMTRAHELLMTTPLKVYEVGLKVGYPSYRYFVRVFKQYFGIFPTQARNRKQEEDS